MPPQNQIQLDPQVVALSKAIIQTESGGNPNAKGASGESGLAQWMPNTWKAHASTTFGDSNAPMTVPNQKAVLYTILARDKANGLNPAQIAAKWNSGSPTGWENKVGTNSMGVAYNVPAYVKKVTDTYQTFKGQEMAQPGQNAAIAPTVAPTPQDNSGALFPASENDNGFTAGLKAIGNLPGSAFNFVKGVFQSLNPLQTANTLGQVGSGFQDLAQQEGAGQAVLDIIKGLPQAAYETLVPQSIQQLVKGDISGAAQSFTNDPFGQAAPLVLAAEGGAKLADRYGGGLAKAAERNATNFGRTGINVMPDQGAYSQAFDKGISTVAKPVVDAGKSAVKLPVKVATSVASHLTGLNPETMTAIVSDPTSFSKLQRESFSRPSVAENFGSAVDELVKAKEDTGAEYQPIRANNTPVQVPQGFISDTLNKFGLKLENGKIIPDTNSITRNTSDINAVQKFVNDWGNKSTLTSNEFLNMRSDLADLANYDKLTGIGKTKSSQVIGNELRQEANRLIRPQIKGLSELDAKMSPQIEFYKKIRKDFLNPDGTLKDGAANKIANAGGIGKEKLLARIEQVSPGITKSIKVLKAIEDIERANGIKVGTYARAAIEGGGILTGNIPVVIAAILTHPEVAVQILRGFGYAGKTVIPVLQYLHILTGNIKTEDLPKVAKSLGVPKATLQELVARRQLAGEVYAQKLLENSKTLALPAGDIKASNINQGRPIPIYSGGVGKEFVGADTAIGKSSPAKSPGGTPTKAQISANKQLLKINTPKVSPYEPYVPPEKLPVIKTGSKPRPKPSNLKTIR